MTKKGSGSKKMKIKVRTQNGQVDPIVDDNNNPATEMTPEEVEQLFQSSDGPKYVGTILYTHSSPGCVYIIKKGKVFKVCY
jgi:hypothetical protein